MVDFVFAFIPFRGTAFFLSLDITDKTSIAYEPIWSIGTGKIPSYEEISEISNLIKDFFVKFRKNCNLSIVYGGSVDSLNFRKISEIKNINGNNSNKIDGEFKTVNNIGYFIPTL